MQQHHQQNCIILCLCLLALGTNIVKSAIPSDDSGASNSDIVGKSKITVKKEEIQPVAAVATAPQERSTPPDEIEVRDSCQ